MPNIGESWLYGGKREGRGARTRSVSQAFLTALPHALVHTQISGASPDYWGASHPHASSKPLPYEADWCCVDLGGVRL